MSAGRWIPLSWREGATPPRASRFRAGRRAALLLALVGGGVGPAGAVPASAGSGGQGWHREVLSLGKGVTGLELLAAGARPSADRRPARLVVLRRVGLEVLPLATSGEGDPAPPASLRVLRGMDRTLAVSLPRGEGTAGTLWLLRDGGRVLETDGGSPPREVFRAEGVSLPEGTYALDFVRDLDGDGRLDLLLPQRDGLRLARGAADGFREGSLIPLSLDAGVVIPAPRDLPGEVSQRLVIPAIELFDQNGDGRPDLLFRDEDRVQAFWASPEGAFGAVPSFEVDLASLREALPRLAEGTIDPANLFGSLASTVQERVLDLDGDGFVDLLLRQGPKVAVYRGTREGIPRERAAQVLRSSGNLLTVTTLDEDRDGRDDLAMLRVSDVSLADVLRWIVLGGRFTFELLVYRQEEPLRFARTPTRRRRLRLSFPSLLSMGDDPKGGEAEGEEDRARLPVTADLDGDGRRDDVAWLRGPGGVDVFLDGAGGDEIAGAEDSRPGNPLDPRRRRDRLARMWRDLLRRFDERAGKGGELAVSFAELEEFDPTRAPAMRERLAGRRPTVHLTLPGECRSWFARDSGASPPGGGFPVFLGAGPRRGRGARGAEAPSLLLAAADVNGDRSDDLLLVRVPREGEECRVVVWTTAEEERR